MKDNEFIASLEGELSHEQVAQLLGLSDEGDTDSELSEQGGAPDAATADDQTEQGTADANKGSAPNEDELDADNTVILARDGKHTIGYDQLVKARDGEKHWKAQAAAAAQELETLKAQAQQRADAGIAPTATDTQVAVAEAAIEAGLDPELFGDFSEEGIAKGVQALVDQRVAAAMAQVDAKLAQAYEPVQKQQAEDVRKAHFDAIYAAHPDADSIAESKELADWIAAQPSFARAGYEAVMANGTAAEAIELFNSFKGASDRAPQPASTDVKAAARAVMAKSQAQPPVSLSDIPGGRASAASGEEAMAGMEGADLIAAMHDWPQEKIDRYMNSL